MVVGARQEDAASSRADFGVDEPARDLRLRLLVDRGVI
jgi:hypothetical protein